VCYFAVPAAVTNLELYIDAMNNRKETVLQAITEQPGIRALVIEWVTSSAATDHYRDEQVLLTL
jgi:hypothetical protein